MKGAVDAGAESLYLAMFDEIDEGQLSLNVQIHLRWVKVLL